MLFLMNDAVLELDGDDPEPPSPARLRSLTLRHVLKLGAELFSDAPLLHHEDPARARKLALLILAKSPEVNAALFSAPAAGCPPQAVSTRVETLPMEVLCALREQAAAGGLTPASADREVWRRMAA